MKEFSLYKIRFFDHHIGEENEIVIDAVGFFIKENDRYAIFSHWLVDTKCEETKMSNLEKFALVKNCIISCKEIKH